MKKADLQAFLTPPSDDLDIPEWGGHVRIVGLSLAAWLALIDKYREEPGNRLMYEMLAQCVFDEDNEPMFEDAAVVSALPASHMPVVMRLIEAVQALNGDAEGQEKN